MMQDVRDTIRALRASRVASAVAVLSLALGIGANTALFSILNGLLLKPLPVRAPQELISIASGQRSEDVELTYPIWQEVRDRRLLDSAFAWTQDRLSLAAGSEAVPVQTIWATGGFFSALGVPAIVGRPFSDSDDQRRSGSSVAVISDSFGQRRFGSAPDAVGRTLTIERVPFVIVGVTPPAFTGLSVGDAFDVILPLESEPMLGRRPQRLTKTWPWLHVGGRLRPGQTVDSMTAALRAAQPQIRAATMPDYARAEDRDRFLKEPLTVRSAATGTSRLRERYTPALAVLLAIVGLVLLVACANIANLQLARTAARRHELSIRVALGAARWRIARLMLVEGLMLSIAGGALGAAFAWWGSRLIVAQLTTWYSPAFLDLSPDWRVLAVTGLVTVATTVLFGTAPALRATHADPMDALRQRQGFAIGGRFGVGGALVVGQLALSLLLVAGAGIFIRSFAALAYRDVGFDRGRLLVAVIDAKHALAPPDARAALYDRLRASIAEVPGVESAALSMATPFGNAGIRFSTELSSAGRATLTGRLPRIFTTAVSPGWFHTFGTRVVVGRDFDDRDTANAPPVAIVNQAFAAKYFDGGSPLGRSILARVANKDARDLQIVGLVQDAAFTSARGAIEPTIYTPLVQTVDGKMLGSFPTMSVSVRSATRAVPESLRRAVATAVGGVDGQLAVSFVTVAEQLDANFIRERLLALLSGFFGGLALLLAAIGLYGVTAHAVNRRRAEIGIRMALGASARLVERAVLGRVAMLSTVGVAAGIVAIVWASKAVEGLVYGITARDPATIGSAAAILTVVALVAGWLPARRAARIDPIAVLRESAN